MASVATRPPWRLDSVDALRGLVMILMALDHVRDYFFTLKISPTDLEATTPVLFLSRWVTHFCAPLFVLLAGAGVFLQGARGRTKSELSWMLMLRGLWMIVLEFTVVSWAWAFNVGYGFVVGQVIWAIGISMLALSALVWLPTSIVGVFGVAMIVLHNVFDTLVVAPGEPGFIPWSILHGGRPIELSPDRTLMPLYPLIPWVGVMAAGYALGAVLVQAPEVRTRRLRQLGFGLIAGFLLLRFGGLYGDPKPWERGLGWARSWMSFLSCSKYPPSLQYLMMTLGPGILLLSWLDRWSGRLPGVLVTFGRVPMFYYLGHLYLIHLLSGVSMSLFGRPEDARFIWHNDPFFGAPEGYGFPLWATFVGWAVVVALLYPACVWFAGVKERNRGKAWTRLI